MSFSPNVRRPSFVSHLRPAALSLSVVVATLSGCASGDLDITIYGEDFIEAGIPAEVFADGGAVTFDRFLVNVSQLAVKGGDGVEGGAFAGPVVFDVTQAGPTAVTSLSGLEARRYEDISAVVAPAAAATAGNASADDVALMNDNGHSVFVSGTASFDGEDFTFAWGFDTDTAYVDCALEDESSGVVVPAGAAGEWQLTIHGDHLFYDDLADEGAVLRLAAVAAADADENGDVTLAELAAVDLTTLPPDQYGTGGAGDVNTLADFMGALTRTLVHHTGEGHCTSQVR
jgi:hypothetical protein